MPPQTQTELRNDAPIKFQIFTRTWDQAKSEFVPSALTASVGPDSKMRLNGIASSTVKDLHGDTITSTALLDMERAANNNLTIFGNHSYDVPEDVYGSVEMASLSKAMDFDANGEAVHLLNLGIVINDENERAVSTWKAIKKGTRLGLSIGAMIPEGGAKIDRKKGTLTIDHVELLETSIVGIPANPRSWVENAVKSFHDATKAPDVTAFGDTNKMWLSRTLPVEIDFAEEPEEPEGGWATKHEKCGYEAAGTFADGICPGCGEADVFKAFPVTELKAMCPSCGKGKGAGGCDDSYHKDVEPDLEKVKVRVTVDTGEDKTPASSPDAGTTLTDEDRADVASEPDNTALGDTTTRSAAPTSDDGEHGEAPDLTNSANEAVTKATALMADLDPEITSAFQQLVTFVNALTDQVIAAKTAEREALTAKARAEQERDASVASAGAVITQAQAIIDKLGALSLGPRAAIVREASDDLADLEGTYSREFLELLRSK